MVVLPIGGADMPVVISLLNALTGLSAAAAGMALDNVALIVGGTIVGASGTILTNLMAEAMNRSIPSIVAGGFGGGGTAPTSRRRRGAPSPLHRRPVGGQPAVAGGPRGRGPGLRPGGGPGSAHRARAGRRAGEARRGGVLCHPPCRGAHARPHERAAGRGRRALRRAQGDGRDQPRVRHHRRDAGDRRERRDEPRRALERGQPDLRHADPGRGQVRPGGGAQALDEHRASRGSTTRSSTTRTPRCCSATRSPPCRRCWPR